jgi:hypothetical protein
MSEPFRSGSTVTETNTSPEVEVGSNEPTTQRDSDVEPAFTLYESAKNQSFIAEYLGLTGDGNKEVYENEIQTIENYFKEKVKRGDIENTTDAVKSVLKKAEKDLKFEEEDRTVVKVEKLVAYLKFKLEVEDIMEKNRKYGYNEN